jgi:secreted Zn-dependent insulinase-like peptidase
MELNITLTDKGVARVRDVLGYAFHFIKMLQDN